MENLIEVQLSKGAFVFKVPTFYTGLCGVKCHFKRIYCIS